MALPVVTVASGGLAVVDVTATLPKMGLPVTEATNGRGIAVTRVAAGGLPVTFKADGIEWLGPPNPPPIVGGGGGSPAADFLARTSGLDATHTTAYTNLINGLVTDGVWSKLDMLHVYATQNSTTALLNLVSTSYNGTANGSPTFTVDRGFTGVDASTTIYINTGLNVASGTHQFVLNSAHMSCWNLTEMQSFSQPLGNIDASSNGTFITIRGTDNNARFRLNSGGGGAETAPNTVAVGHYTASRGPSSGGFVVWGYKNGSSVMSNNLATVGLMNGNIYSLGTNNNGTPAGSPFQTAMISAGGALTSTEVAAFYTRLRTYMTAVGVP